MKKQYLKLYWCTTYDHSEDWCILAYSAREARTAHADMEGYETSETTSELICRVPDRLVEEGKASRGYPSDDLLKELGIEQAVMLPGSKEALSRRDLLGQGGRVLVYKGRKFVEGTL